MTFFESFSGGKKLALDECWCTANINSSTTMRVYDGCATTNKN